MKLLLWIYANAKFIYLSNKEEFLEKSENIQQLKEDNAELQTAKRKHEDDLQKVTAAYNQLAAELRNMRQQEEKLESENAEAARKIHEMEKDNKRLTTK